MKLVKILVAALVMAAMVTPAIAEDRLVLSGSMQVRGFFADYDLESGVTGNGTLAVDERDNSAAWNDSRLRIGGKLAVAEGVSVHFRFDAAESNENSSDPAAWGSTSDGSVYRYTTRRGDIQFDKAYLQLEKHGFTLMAGQMYFGGFGLTQAFHDSAAAGFIAKFKGLTIAHSKNSEENLGNETLQINSLSGDSSTSAIQYVFKIGDNFSITPIVAYTIDDTRFDEDILGLGLVATAKLGPVELKGEVDYFEGERDGTYSGAAVNNFVDAPADLKGLQFFLDGSVAATDAIKVGAQFLWADGQDGGDVQVTTLADDFRTNWDFVDFNPQTLGTTDLAYCDNFDIFDPSKFYGESGAGVVAGGLYANLKANDALVFDFGGMYFQSEDDSVSDVSGYFLNAKVAYKVMTNTTLSTHLNYMSIDKDNDLVSDTTDEALGLLTTLAVSF